MEKHTGSCICGAVRFTVEGPLPAPYACHCTICRKFSGHYYSGSDVPREHVKVEGEENVTWYRSSDKARRGFCKVCGASLFFDPTYRDWFGISMGAFDKPTGTKLAIHIFTADKGDYYDIDEDGVPKYDQMPPQP